MIRSAIALALALCAVACASAPPAVVAPAPVAPSFDQKMSWILRLEDQRSLRDPSPAPAPPPPPQPGKPPATAPPIPPTPDLVRLLDDAEARVRRRAALAVGHVGLSEGIDPLVTLLADPDAEVRQMAAFALGLLGDPRSRGALVTRLQDPSPLVQGSAAEALGLIGDRAAAEPIGRMLEQVIDSGVLATPPGDADESRRDTPSAAFRFGVNALVRLKAFDQLAAAVLDAAGQPRVRWWPVAYALQRLEDPRGLKALLTLATDTNSTTRAFAVKGLGGLKDRASLPLLAPLATAGDRTVAFEAVRALGNIGDPSAAITLLKIVQDRRADPELRAEAVSAIGGTHAGSANEVLLDLLSEPNPAIRAAALASSAELAPEDFITVLSGLDVDPSWIVRSTLAKVLGGLRAEIALPRLKLMLNDADQRVIPSVLASLVTLHDPSAPAVLLEKLTADDPAVRAAAAAALGDLRPDGGAAALAAAYTFGKRDDTYIARAAALSALVRYGAGTVQPVLPVLPVLNDALEDKDWAVRVRAASLLKQIDPSSDADRRIRPAPTRRAPEAYQAPRLIQPPVSTQVFIVTDRGTIQIELAVLDAPLTVDNFVTLARAGFFNGLSIHRVVRGFVVQAGDPRGDGEGGPGYTIRDELNELPYLRGTVGMALDWADTGGSQFFITESPQPHLDAKYTAFGRVIAGMDVVSATERGDVIRTVRVWDGQD